MLLTLFDQTGIRKLDISPADSSTQVKEIQADNILSLSFTSNECAVVGVNDYVDFLGERYWAMSEYAPNEVARKTWKYDIRLYGMESLIKRYLVLDDSTGENNPEFTLTAPASEHLALIVNCINAGMGTDTWTIGNAVQTENLVIDYSGIYCDEALKLLAEKAGTEYWFDGTTVNLCRCEHGEEIPLGYGRGVLSITPATASNAKFYTRLFPLGSTRNIDPERYGHRRLQLPDGAKFVDINVDKYGVIHHYEESAFSGIYPRRIGTVTGVRSEDVTDSEGNPYTIYHFKDDSLDFNPNSYQLANEVIHVSFLEGSELAGLGTSDDHYFEVNWDEDTCEFEIITQWPEGTDSQLPGGLLVPHEGDEYILWNMSMPDEYYPLAEQEFKNAVDAYNAAHGVDMTIYKCPTDHVWIEENDIILTLGQRVKLESVSYFPGTGYRSSRIIKMTRRVNLPTYVDLEIGDAISRSAMTKIEDSIREVRNYARELSSSKQGSIKILKTGDPDPATEYNVLSAKRTSRTFLKKNQPDTAQEKITFEKGIGIGTSFSYEITPEGVAHLAGAVANYLQSENFETGLLGGQGYGIWTDENGKTHVESDYLTTRIKAVFAELEIRKMTYSGGNFIFSSAGSRIYRVIPVDSAYRCYFVADDGTTQTANWWKVGDQAHCQTFNIKSGVYQNVGNRYYWRLVVNVGEEMLEDGKMYNYADLSDIKGLVILEDEQGVQHRCIGMEDGVENDIPAVEDTIVQMGNQIDTTRQGMYQIVVYGDEAPGTFMYNGINDYNLSNHIVMQNSPRGMKVLASNFEVVSNANANVTAPIVCYRGNWTSGMVCGHYDSVDHGGSEWLCTIPIGQTTTEEPSSASSYWRERVKSGTSVTVTASFVVYQVGDSGTTAPTGTWSNAVPAAQQGKYLWSKHVVNYSDGTHTEVFSVSRYGTDGTSVSITSTAVNYGKSNAADVLPSSWVGDVTQLHVLPGEYLWTRTVVTYSDGQSTTAYGISRIGADGTNGDPGAAGQNGQTTYVHIAYATDTEGTNFSTTLDRSDFYKCWGTYTDYTQADSTDWHDYNWSYFKGEKGDTGAKGDTGPSGADGISALSKGKWTSELVEDNGGSLPQSSIVMMGDGSYISKKATALPPFFTYLSPAGKRYVLAGGGYLLNGKVNNEWNLVARHGTDGIDGAPGPTGPQGPKGEPGTGVSILGNYDTLAQLQAAHPTGSASNAYMVGKNIYVWNVQYNQWRDAGQFKGDDGVSSYFHVKYSNDGGVTFTPDDGEQVGAYIGTYVDFHEDDSMNPGDYKWKLMEGAPGADGRNGIDGQNGADGRTSYLHIKYSDDGQTFTANDGETPGDWLGQYVDFTQADSTTFSDYRWAHIKGQQGLRGLQGPQGAQGIQGPKGEDGKTPYFHIKYSSVANPTQTSQIHETPDVYIGTYVDYVAEDSASPSKYTWARFQGLQGANGEQGIPGTNGTDGKTYYLHIAYANSADGTEGFSVSDSVNKIYIGQYTDSTQADSTSPAKYSWTKIKGEQGPKGEDGVSAEFLGNWSTTLLAQKGGQLGEGNIVRMGGGSYGVKTTTANPPCWTYLSPAGKRYKLAGGGYLLNGILNTADWQEVANDGANGKDGADGMNGSFKSMVFLRSNTQPTTPIGGTYDNPIPIGWSDGIPAGEAKIWATVCTFHADGTSSGWSIPALQSDSDTLDIEFSPNPIKPANPAGNDPKADNRTERNAQGWFDPSASGFDGTAMKWRAERKVSNGQYVGAWVVSQMLGEQGASFNPLGRWSSALVEENGGSLPRLSVVLMGRDSYAAKRSTALPAGKRYKLAGGGYLLNGNINITDWAETAYGGYDGLPGTDGQNGANGADGIDIALSPAVIIINQSADKDAQGNYPLLLDGAWTAPMGAQGATSMEVKLNSITEGDAQSRCTWQAVEWIDDGGFNGGKKTVRIWIKSIKTYQSVINGTTVNLYWDTGTLNVNVTVGGLTKTLALKWHVNLLGTVITRTVGDMTETLREKGVFDANDNYTAASYTKFVSQYKISAQGQSTVFQTMQDDIEDSISAIEQNADDIKLRVSKAALKQTAGIDIDANRVRLNGQITANDNVHINADGTIDAKGGSFSGIVKNEFTLLDALLVSHLNIEGWWYIVHRFSEGLRYCNVYLNAISNIHVNSFLDLPQDAYGASFLIYNNDGYNVELRNYGTALIGNTTIGPRKAKRATCVGNKIDGFKGYIFEDLL